MKMIFLQRTREYGKGTKKWPDGSRYVGGFKDDLPHGSKCIWTDANGYTFEGGFNNGKPHGKGGISKRLDGSVEYNGDFLKTGNEMVRELLIYQMAKSSTTGHGKLTNTPRRGGGE
jgi:hypothetical protein